MIISTCNCVEVNDTSRPYLHFEKFFWKISWVLFFENSFFSNFVFRTVVSRLCVMRLTTITIFVSSQLVSWMTSLTFNFYIVFYFEGRKNGNFFMFRVPEYQNFYSVTFCKSKRISLSRIFMFLLFLLVLFFRFYNLVKNCKTWYVRFSRNTNHTDQRSKVPSNSQVSNWILQ